MCQIIAYHSSDWKNVGDLDNKIRDIMYLLKDKGGDFFSVANTSGLIKTKNEKYPKFIEKVSKSSAKEFEKFLREDLFTSSNLRELVGTLLFFSRQTPSLEDTDYTFTQPYIKEVNHKHHLFAVHGTVPNTKELEEKYQIKLKVDTDIFNNNNFLNKHICNNQLILRDSEDIKGSFVVVHTNEDSIEIINNGGLGYWEIHKTDKELMIAMSKVSDSKYCGDYDTIYYINDNKKKANGFRNGKSSDKYMNVFLCSGGLDSICTTLYTLNNEPQDFFNNHLVYIAWGTRAEEEEIKAVKAFRNELRLLGFNFELDIIDAKDLFKYYLIAAGYDLDNIRLLAKDSKGQGKEEAEYGSSYVPLRNTFMVNLLAARFERIYPDGDVTFYLGLNLDDGMAANMLDNTNGWLHCINQTVRLSGSKTLGFKVAAPYVNKTKLNMIKDVIEMNPRFKEIIEKSFSCYFPKDGNVCGECGSCLMRQNAFGRVSDEK